MDSLSLMAMVVAVVMVLMSTFFYWQSRESRLRLEKREQEMQRRMYELAILKELGDRIGYSLNIQQIVDVITGSLHQFIEYNAVSYMLLQPEKILFKVHLEDSVSREFVNEVKDRMLKSLSALLNKEFTSEHVEEVLSGAIIIEDIETPVNSFFNIPLVIGEKVVGVLTVAHTQQGLYKEEETTILYKITQQASQAVTRLQEVIQTEQRKLDAMVKSMTEGVVMTDKDYRIVVINPAAKQVIGLTDKTEITIFDFIDNLGGAFDIRGKLEESVKLDKIMVADNVSVREKFYQIFVTPVKSQIGVDKNEVLGGVVIFHDITKEKQVEKMREDFTSMMVHELRSPLDGIRMMSELMQKNKESRSPKNLKDNIHLIHQSSSTMLGLVNDLLDAAKLESGKFEIHPEPTNMTELINDLVKFYHPTAIGKKIELKAVFGGQVDQEIEIDSIRITQVLNNLMSNALKFTLSGGQVLVQCFRHDKDNSVNQEADLAGIKWLVKKTEPELIGLPDSIIVAVTDSGEGISSENITRLFNKFIQFQVTKKDRQQKGTGLGLVIAKGIVGAHEGKIGVVSEEGKGTTFFFTLPIQKAVSSL
ncbi:MAG: ATP-binding protein [Patescibacteria group bacterium]